MSPEEHCPELVECFDDCDERIETRVLCPPHQKCFDACLEAMGEIPNGRTDVRERAEDESIRNTAKGPVRP